MATNFSVSTTDDLDGSQDAMPVTFGIDGTSFVIDLGPGNRAKLEGALAPVIAAARRRGPGRARRHSGRSGSRTANGAAVRAWAREAGLPISERGRISANVIRQYEAAH
jgi:hypothetical protein